MKELCSELDEQIALAQRMNEHIRNKSLTMRTMGLKEKTHYKHLQESKVEGKSNYETFQ